MIKTLQIKNYAIIEQLEIQFSKGLTIITGETGAGKSILLGALGLIMGKRADTKALYDTTKKCIVEAYFEVGHYNGLRSFFEANDIDYEEETVVRREITPSGKTRAFVNDTPVNLKVLQQLSSSLVDLHQQFDTQDINDVSFQLRMVDSLADNGTILEEYDTLFKKHQSNERRLKKLIQQNENSAKETDFLNFQLDEFNKAELVEDEQDGLEKELAQLSNAEEIKAKLSGAFMHLSESEQSILGQLSTLGISLNQVQKYHSGLAPLIERYDGLVLELGELANEFEGIAEDTEHNPERATEVQQRLDLIYRLQKKHGVNSVPELIEIQEDIAQQLTSFGDLSNEIIALENELTKSELKLRKIAQQLTKRRKGVVKNFLQLVHEKLALLSMENARLQIDISPSDTLLPTGTDIVEFLFAPNKGSRFLSIKQVASGGELSRLTLCIKSLVASSIPLPTLIFDEIDAGVSGDVALKMGRILRKLSNEHQVVVITHSPQVASKANAHYFVYKKVDGQRTKTKVRALDQAERIRAIATMLSTNPPSESAIENAKELLAMG
ncbi:MAG: DNA repair protein RecN [Bacteroidota bacterium]